MIAVDDFELIAGDQFEIQVFTTSTVLSGMNIGGDGRLNKFAIHKVG
jgi:hypothetical protein